MDVELVKGLLETIQNAMVSNKLHDDVAVSIFNPDKSYDGAAAWCESFNKLGDGLNWISFEKVAKAGKALRGSALSWFETWDPETDRSWEEFKKYIVSVYLQRKNLNWKLLYARLYTSDSADSFDGYAREKLRLLKSTKICSTEGQLIQLICGGISDLNVKMASLISSVESTADLIYLLSTYTKLLKKAV
ncbi:unnamed protein product [Parnassius apollo]|uniref:(apollo) hypothetical protein n=1 Tax=Parnassius apollo TaxID=110799 RepID=A0A8S3Y6T4_PARAO|nr:unnamed protein product [Parnassius apollo]